jgi:diguanylate cyclase (GGDEF)-like protein
VGLPPHLRRPPSASGADPGDRGILSAVNKTVLRLLPGALLLMAVTVALYTSAVRSAAAPIVPAFPLTVLVGGILLAWRFDRSRLVLALAVLLLADQALLSWAPASGAGGDVGRVVFGALTLLVPLDLAILAWLPDRGLLARPTQGVLALFAAEVVLLVLLCQPLFLPLAGWLEVAPGQAGLAVLPRPALVAFALAFVAIAWRAVVQGTALESGTVWTLVAAFLALSAGGGGLDSSLYLATGGLILVLSLIETWHGMAYDDELTGLPARRALTEALARLGGRYTVAMVDVDRFKRFNDEHGHDVGDQILRMVGVRLAEIGGGGRAFRYGGEEFAVLFPGKDVEETREHLETLRRTIEAAPFMLRAPGRPRIRPESVPASGPRRRLAVTVSIGVAGNDGKAGKPDRIIQAADEALYRAKQGGRNQVRT